ncbi:MAG TPA: hypothetical protein VGP25_13130 [Gemmatimonadaceae bacterium]|nr:hypothetical protein [Gemmatimonadaceae bacterium]
MRLALAVLLLPAIAGAQGTVETSDRRINGVPAQEVVLRDAGPTRVASIVRGAIAQPHTLRAGHDVLVLRRDTLFTTNLLVLGRPTYLASRVQGDVVVVGADLFLRPGSDVSGRAIAIGGTVSRTFLGRVGGSVESYRDDSYDIAPAGNGYALAYRGREPDPLPVFQLAGVQGLLMPSYDRVDGLSLPVGVLLTIGQRALELQPMATYRSRLGVVDPGVVLRVAPGRTLGLEAEAGRSTRTNDAWIYGDLLNSAATIAFGNDARNYFRTDGGTARVIGRIETDSYELEPFVGGRYEKVSPITATGDVWAFSGRKSVEHMLRPNPLVEKGTIGSALAGARLTYRAGTVKAKLDAEAEKSTQTPAGTSSFVQLTLDGSIDFPTFAGQRLRVDAHAVTTSGDSVPTSRYAYLGRASTLPLMELLEQGGDRLLFVESRYKIPISSIIVPKLGSPTVFLRHLMGAAGVGSLPKLEQELGAGVGLSVVRADYTVDAAGKRDAKFSFGFSLGD